MENLYLQDAQSLRFQGKQRSVDFALSFSERSARPFVLRLTGGCSKMTAADGIAMRNLTKALRGRKGADALPRFAGFALFGGTRMLSIADPTIVVPGITEIFPEIARDCPGTVMLGVVPNFHGFERSRHADLSDKLILSVDNNVITVVHPDLNRVLMLEASADRTEPWDDEYQECYRLVKSLHDRNWQSLLVVYNGGTVTKRELELWATSGLKQPGKWPVLLIKGSGRAADEYAENQEFLLQHPDVHVADNSVEDINAKLDELGALVDCEDGPIVLPMHQAG